MSLLSLGNLLNAGFEQIYNLYNPSVYQIGDIIDTYMYRLGMEEAQYSFGTAVGLFKSVISCFLISVSYWAAQVFLAAIPLLAIYPFLQKYFTKGLTLGSVKG